MIRTRITPSATASTLMNVRVGRDRMLAVTSLSIDESWLEYTSRFHGGEERTRNGTGHSVPVLTLAAGPCDFSFSTTRWAPGGGESTNAVDGISGFTRHDLN